MQAGIRAKKTPPKEIHGMLLHIQSDLKLVIKQDEIFASKRLSRNKAQLNSSRLVCPMHSYDRHHNQVSHSE